MICSEIIVVIVAKSQFTLVIELALAAINIAAAGGINNKKIRRDADSESR